MKKSLIPPDFRILLRPLALICAMVILAAVIYNVGVSRVSQENAQLATAKKNEAVLAERATTLESVSGTVTSQAKAADAAVPNLNPGLVTLSQLRSLAAKTSLTVIDFGVGSEIRDIGTLSRVEVSVTVEGQFGNVISFISQLNTIAPIAVPGKIRITSSGGLSRGLVAVSSYFSPLPTKLPALTEPVTKLTTAETDTITKVTSLSQPAFLELTPQPGAPRPNPF